MRNKAALLQIVTTILGAVTVVLMVIAGAEAVSGNQFGTADAGLGRRLYLPAVSNEYLTRTATPGPQGVWTKKADLNMRRTALGAVTGSNGKLYAIGGYTYVLSPYGDRISTVVAKVEEYDHIANTWTEKADMPTARTDLGVATAGNGKIYAIGGSSRGFPDLRTVEEYDPATNVWTTKADMPTSRRSLGVATAGNGKIYAIGGWSVGGPIIHSKVEEYDPATNVWTKKADMPTWRQMLGLVAGSNGKLYAVGGSTNGPSFRTSRDLATVEEYDPATDSWTTKSSMPTARSQLGVATAGNGKLYAIGGSAGFYAIGGSVGSKVEEYDLATDSWSAKANMLTARSFLAVATGSNGKLYAIGGYIDGEPGSVIVEEFDPDRSPSTATPTITLTVPAVSTSTPQSGTPTLTRTPTPTSTSTATASANNTGTQTSTPNVTSTATATPTPTPTPTPTLTVPPA